MAALAQGDVIEVYGLYNAFTDRLTATRIERKSSPPANYRVRGKVSSLNTTNKTFSIGSLPISYVTLSGAEIPANLANGTVLRIRLNPTPTAGVFAANRLRGGASTPDDSTESKVEGLIDSFISATQFSVAGVPVTTNAQTQFDLSGGALLVGVRAQVEGTFANGTLVAKKVEVEFDSGDDFDFRGLLQTVNVGTNTLTIQGVSIDTSGPIQFDSGKSAADLVVGANVRVRASLVNGTQLKAYRIQFRN